MRTINNSRASILDEQSLIIILRILSKSTSFKLQNFHYHLTSISRTKDQAQVPQTRSLKPADPRRIPSLHKSTTYSNPKTYPQARHKCPASHTQSNPLFSASPYPCPSLTPSIQLQQFPSTLYFLLPSFRSVHTTQDISYYKQREYRCMRNRAWG